MYPGLWLIPNWGSVSVELRGRGESPGRAGTAPAALGRLPSGGEIAAWLAAGLVGVAESSEGRGAMGWKALVVRQGLPEDFFED